MPQEKNSIHDNQEHQELHLHKEELQISKKWVETADVKIYKNTYKEEKQITVPLFREELVIEKKPVIAQGTMDGQIETIRIPLSEERIEVTKYPIILEDVEIYKHQFEEILQINESLKEEKLHIHTIGDLKLRKKQDL